MKTINIYIQKKFWLIFLYCVISVIVLFVVLDFVENMDSFIDRDVPGLVVLEYYVYYIPFILVLTLPVATLMATVFSVGSLSRTNEILAFKALGISIYQLLYSLMISGFIISILSFVLAEGIAAKTNQKKIIIEQDYLGKTKHFNPSQMRNLKIRERDYIITIGFFQVKDNTAQKVKIEKITDNKLAARWDTDTLRYENGRWEMRAGSMRLFNNNVEDYTKINSKRIFDFGFDPEELINAQSLPDNMGLSDLKRYVDRVRSAGGNVDHWMTEIHLRISYPLSNLVIVFFSLPIVYNIRKKNLAIGFGISLAVCFFYFGTVKLGQTLGHSSSIQPVLGAWLGNIFMTFGSIVNLGRTRK